MKLSEVFDFATETSDPTDKITGILSDYFIALKASGVDRVPISAVTKEIDNKFGIELTFDSLTDLFNSGKLPMLKNLTSDEVQIGQKETTETPDLPDSKDTVKRLARKASRS